LIIAVGVARGWLTLLACAQSSDGQPFVARRDYLPGQWLNGNVESGVWDSGYPELILGDGSSFTKATLQLNVAGNHCWWMDPEWCSLLFDAQVRCCHHGS
jgi:hypothetical protein